MEVGAECDRIEAGAQSELVAGHLWILASSCPAQLKLRDSRVQQTMYEQTLIEICTRASLPLTGGQRNLNALAGSLAGSSLLARLRGSWIQLAAA